MTSAPLGESEQVESGSAVRAEEAATLRASALPAALANVVQETVRRTRVRRRERRALEAELTAHFRDGLAEGQTAAALAKAFGVPKLVAPLLRRSIVAKRHLLDWALLRSLKWAGIGLAAILAVYVLAAMRLWWQSPTIAFDPIARLNARQPEAGDKPAWPLYKEGLLWARTTRGERLAGKAQDPGDEVAGLTVEPGMVILGEGRASVDAEQWRQARESDAETLRGHQAQLARIREAASRPALGYELRIGHHPADVSYFTAGLPQAEVEGFMAEMKRAEASPGFPALSMLLPQLAELGRAARLLAADAWLAAEEGDGARAAADLVAILGVATHAEENGTLIGQLVGTHQRQLASRHLRLILAVHPDLFDAPDLEALGGALSRIPQSAFTIDLAAEKIGFEDFLQRIYTDDGRGDGALLPQGLMALEQLSSGHFDAGDAAGGFRVERALSFAAGPAGAMLDPGRRAALDAYSRLLEATERESRIPSWDPEAGAELSKVEAELFGSRPTFLLGPGASPVVRLMAPAIGHSSAVRRSNRTVMDAAAVAVALNRYRVEQGQWPATLDALVPKYLTSVPRDPFDGQPLRYELRDGAPLLWSIGNDRIDDGGRPPAGGEDELDPGSVARWRPMGQRPGFLDSATGQWIERRGAGQGDWILWDATTMAGWAPGARVIPETCAPGQVSHFGG